MSGALNYMERAIHFTSKWFNRIAMVPLTAMMFLVAIDVCLRYFFRRPITGSNDLEELMLIVIVYCSIAHTQFLKGHVSVTLVTDKLHRRAEVIANIIIYFFSTAICGLMGVATINLGRLTLLGQTSGEAATATLEIPTAPFILIAGAGLITYSLELLVELLHSISDLKGETFETYSNSYPVEIE